MSVRILKSKIHPLVQPHTEGYDFEEFFKLNVFMHMRDLFDKKRLITDVKFNKDEVTNYFGKLTRYRCHINLFEDRQIIKKRIKNSYEMDIMNKISEDLFKAINEDSDYMLLFDFEKTMLHEFAHLVAFAHNKKFRKTLRRYMIKWVAWKLGESQLKIRKMYGFYFDAYINTKANGD